MNILAKFAEGTPALVDLDQVFGYLATTGRPDGCCSTRIEQLRQWRLSVEKEIKEIPPFLS